MKSLNVHMLPTLTHPHETAGRSFVVIDVLRASTTIATALASGATEILPCLEVDEAHDLAHRAARASEGDTSTNEPASPILLGGERGGIRIPTFDLGNSPAEYSADRVNGRRICFTTTNGTRAMMRCIGASRVVIGAFVNLSAICQTMLGEEEVELMCAGTDGTVTREDVLFAGALAHRLSGSVSAAPTINDQARIAIDGWLNLFSGSPTQAQLAETFRDSHGGRNVVSIGQEVDLTLAADIDRFDIVPELDLSDWRIRKRA